MQKLSLFQRFAADTPKFERGAQFLALICVALLAYASKLGYVPADVFQVLSGFFGGMAVICQFAAANDAEIKTLFADPSQALAMIPQLHDQVSKLVDAIANPPVATLESIEQLGAEIKTPAVIAQVGEVKTIKTQPETDIAIGVNGGKSIGITGWPGADQQNPNPESNPTLVNP